MITKKFESMNCSIKSTQYYTLMSCCRLKLVFWQQLKIDIVKHRFYCIQYILYNFYHFFFCNAVINNLYNNAFTHSAPKPKRTNSQFINNNYQPYVSNRIQLYMFVVMTKVLNKFVVIIGMIRCRYCRGKQPNMIINRSYTLTQGE